MIPVDKGAISTTTLQPKLLHWTGKHSTLSIRAEDTSGLTTSDYLSVYASCVAVSSPDSQRQTVGYFLTDTEGCLISEVRAKGREGIGGIGGIGGRKKKKRHVMGSTASAANKTKHLQSLFICHLFPLLGHFFPPHTCQNGSSPNHTSTF